MQPVETGGVPYELRAQSVSMLCAASRRRPFNAARRSLLKRSRIAANTNVACVTGRHLGMLS